MTSAPAARTATAAADDLHHRFRAMAVDVNVRVCAPAPSAAEAVREAEEVFRSVEAACTRFDPQSPLMLANAAPDRWHVVPGVCLAALREAAVAHRETGGLFDPRVLRELRRWGYDRAFPLVSSPLADGEPSAAGPSGQGPGWDTRAWEPRFDPARSAVHLDGAPVDLGGIGKGLAVRWAAARLHRAGPAVLVEAGGDCYAVGSGPDGDGWLVGVEDPAGGAEPVAVLCLADAACTTSSVRVRTWQAAGRRVHHLVDPRTGEPGGGTLASVTVVGSDPAWSEVWGKALFLAGEDGIAAAAEQAGLAALWVDRDGRLGTSPAIRPLLRWTAAR